MNKFKSVVLLSFLYVGSQAGFSAEQHPGENNAGVLPPQIAGINLEQGQAKLQQVPQRRRRSTQQVLTTTPERVQYFEELLQKNNMPEMSAEEKQNLLLQTPDAVQYHIEIVARDIKLLDWYINEINVLRVEKNMPKLSAEEEQYLRSKPNELKRLLETQKNGKQLNELRAKNGLPYISDDELQHMQDGGRQLDQEIEFQETMLDLPKLLERNGIQMSPEDIQKMSPADRVKEARKQSKVTEARKAVESIGVQMSNEQLQGMSYDALEELCQKAQCIKTLNMPLTSSQDMLLKKLDELKESCTKQYLVNKIEALRSYMIAAEQQKDPQEDLQNESVPQLENLYKQLQKKHRERNELLKALEEVREKTGLQTSAEELKQLPLRELEQLERKAWTIDGIVDVRAKINIPALSREGLKKLYNMTITELESMFDELFARVI